MPCLWRGVRVWSNELVLKTRDRETGPRVRIPPPSLADFRKKGIKNMKIHNITNIDKFFDVIAKCNGRVELVTAEGDRLNLKSTLAQYVALAKVFSDGTIPSLELVVYEAEDIGRLVDYMMYCNAK